MLMRECPQPPAERDWVGQAVIVAGWVYGLVIVGVFLVVLYGLVVVLHAVVGVGW